MKMLSLDINCDIKTVELKDFSQAKNVLGGWAEIVKPMRLSSPYIVLVDEEGLIKQKDINPIASYLYQSDVHGSPIVGKVLVAKIRYEVVRGLEPEDIKVLTNYFKNLRYAYFSSLSNGNIPYKKQEA